MVEITDFHDPEKEFVQYEDFVYLSIDDEVKLHLTDQTLLNLGYTKEKPTGSFRCLKDTH